MKWDILEFKRNIPQVCVLLWREDETEGGRDTEARVGREGTGGKRPVGMNWEHRGRDAWGQGSLHHALGMDVCSGSLHVAFTPVRRRNQVPGESGAVPGADGQSTGRKTCGPQRVGCLGGPWSTPNRVRDGSPFWAALCARWSL